MRLLIAFVVFLGATVAHAETKLAVLPLAAKRVDKATVEILDDLLVNEVDRLKMFAVIGSQDINAVLGLDKMKQALGCSDIECAAEIGGALGVDLLLSGSVSKLGREVIVSLTLLDAKKSEVRSRAQAKAENDESHYAHTIQQAVARLLNLPEPAEATYAPPVSTPPVGGQVGGAPQAFDVGVVPQVPPFAGQATFTGRVTGDLRFTTREAGLSYLVRVRSAAEGTWRDCETRVTETNSCVVKGLPLGQATVFVGEPSNQSFDVVVQPAIETALEIDRQGPAALIMGGAFTGVGVIALAIGLTMDNETVALGDTTRESSMGAGKLILMSVGGGTLIGGLAGVGIGLAVQNMHLLREGNGQIHTRLDDLDEPAYRFAVLPTSGGAMGFAGFSF